MKKYLRGDTVRAGALPYVEFVNDGADFISVNRVNGNRIGNTWRQELGNVHIPMVFPFVENFISYMSVLIVKCFGNFNWISDNFTIITNTSRVNVWCGVDVNNTFDALPNFTEVAVICREVLIIVILFAFFGKFNNLMPYTLIFRLHR